MSASRSFLRASSDETENTSSSCTTDHESESSHHSQELPLVRDHSYLPGASHPLHTVDTTSSAIDNSTAEDVCPRSPPTTELTVLELDGVVLFPGSTFPLRLSRAWAQHLDEQIQASRMTPGQAPPVRLGVLTHQRPPVSPEMRRRQSWTRQGFGPVRLRRFSQQLIQELGDVDELSSGSDNDNEESSEEPPPPRQEELLLLPDRPRENRNNIRFPSDSSSTVSTTTSHGGDRFGYVHRIGTIVTVISTHGDEATDSAHVWRPLAEGEQLVLTTLATGRFRIVGYAGNEDVHVMHRHGRNNDSLVPTYLVQELDDHVTPLPPVMKHPFVATSGMKRESRVIRSLSEISAIPEFVCRNNLPWSLVSKIRESMAQSQAYAGVLETLTGDDETDPNQLSFWMAANLPLTETEKLRLLEMPNAVERLRFVYRKVLREERSEPLIHCKICSFPISRAVHMFTVGGAEGTSGAYVNKYGLCIKHLPFGN